ncbi:MAG: hypothetical protein AAB913_02135 [Patescibacteria group bacterium]|mgnify:CR=1 FL=1
MEKIKLIIKNYVESDKGKDILVIIIIVLVGLGSFELGRLSKDNTTPGIKIEYPNQEANVIESTENSPNKQKSTLKNFFASSKGNKYYSISCSAGKTIKEENRVYFTTSTEAQSAGYELSSSCK